MTAKVRIKAGSVEFEYEGETELSVADIKDLFSHIETLFTIPVIAESGDAPSHPQEHEDSSSPANPSAGPTKKLAVNSVAKALGANTGPEVAVAAAATLQIFEKKESFTRGELLAMMKKATMHYKDNMSGNLTKILKGLVGSKFNEVSDGVYSLNASAYDDLVNKFA